MRINTKVSTNEQEWKEDVKKWKKEMKDKEERMKDMKDEEERKIDVKDE